MKSISVDSKKLDEPFININPIIKNKGKMEIEYEY